MIGIQVPLTKNPGGCSYKTLLNAPPTSWHLIHSPGKISVIHIFCCLLSLRLYEDFLHLHPYRELKRKKEKTVPEMVASRPQLFKLLYRGKY